MKNKLLRMIVTPFNLQTIAEFEGLSEEVAKEAEVPSRPPNRQQRRKESKKRKRGKKKK